MNKKTIILIAGIVVVVLITGLVLVFSGGDDSQNGAQKLLDFFPIGGERDIVVTQPPVFEDGGNGRIVEGEALALNRISSSPVACADFFNNKINYVERQTGHIYEVDLDGQNNNRISNTTIPKVFDCVWSESGDSFVLKYISDTEGKEVIRNFSAQLVNLDEENSITDPQSIEGIFLSQNTLAIASSPLTEKLFHLYENNEGVVGLISDFNNEKQDQVFFSPFTSWNISWPKERKIIFATKPSGLVNGFLYSLDPKTEKFEKVLGGIDGLTALWGFEDKVLYSEAGKNNIRTWLYDTETEEKEAFQFNTLPEKCVFSSERVIYCAVPSVLPPALYPDEWYQGIVSFSDQLWRIDTEEGDTTLILGNINNFDIINLFLSDTEDYLFFTNKKDSTLWSVKLSQ